MESNKTIKIGGAIIFVGILALFGLKYAGNKNDDPLVTPRENVIPITTAGNTTPITKTENAAPISTREKRYVDGTYSAEGLYVTPAGPEKINVTVTLQNNIITNALFDGNATNPNSVKWQGQFSKGFSEWVVGKNIDDVELTVVNGSSLTPKGFLDALEKIKVEATA